MSRHSLESWVDAEFKVLCKCLCWGCSEAHTAALGNKFAQVQDDGGKLKNGAKYQAIGLQFVLPDWTSVSPALPCSPCCCCA